MSIVDNDKKKRHGSISSLCPLGNISSRRRDQQDKVHTNLVEHLVALVEDKVLDVSKLEGLLTDKGKDTAGGTDKDVGAKILVAEDILISLQRRTTVEDLRADLGEVLAEASKLVLDLEGQLASVAENDDRDLAGDGLNLLEGSEDKDGGLTHTRLGLAQNIHTENRLGDTLLLNCITLIIKC